MSWAQTCFGMKKKDAFPGLSGTNWVAAQSSSDSHWRPSGRTWMLTASRSSVLTSVFNHNNALVAETKICKSMHTATRVWATLCWDIQHAHMGYNWLWLQISLVLFDRLLPALIVVPMMADISLTIFTHHKCHGRMIWFSFITVWVKMAIPEAWYKQKGDRDQKQNDDDDDDTEDPDPRRYRIHKGD